MHLSNTSTNDEAKWHVDKIGDVYLFFHPKTSVIMSWIGYVLFAVILYACVKKRIFWKRIHDVLLILFVAFIIDFVEMRMHLFFLFNMQHDKYGSWEELATTVGACTLGVWIFFSHFFITYVHAAVAIFRFIVRFRRMDIPVFYLYAGLGFVFVVLGSLLHETFLFGTTETFQTRIIMPISCTRFYWLDDVVKIGKIVTAVTIAVAPVLSLLMACKKSTKTTDSGVTAFTALSSLPLFTFIYTILFFLVLEAEGYHPSSHAPKIFLLGVFYVESFRFPVYCLLAIVFVEDIRWAVLPIILRTERKNVPETITNEAFIE